MTWEQDRLIAVHDGQRIEMGYIYNSTTRDDEWHAVLKCNGVNESRLPFYKKQEAKDWLVGKSSAKLKEWRADNGGRG